MMVHFGTELGTIVEALLLVLSNDKKRLDPMLSIDLIYSDALFSIISASSNSRMMSIIFGRKLPTGSTEQDAISTIRHIASE